MLTEEQVASFRKNGFLNYGRVLSESQLSGLQGALRRVLEGKSKHDAAANRNMFEGSQMVVTQVVNIWEAEPAFREHLYNAKITEMVAQLIGTDTLRVWHDQVQYKPPRIGGPSLWHQDHPYWPIIQPPDLVSAWVALEDATIENGCMSMVARSHSWGRYQNGTIGTDETDYSPAPDPSFLPEGERIETVPCEVPAGGVVFHHCLTWHGAPPNRSERGRPAIAVHYMPGYTRYEPAGGHLVEDRVEVAPGEVLKGRFFPTVYENGSPIACQE
ncbi:MAG TPA: phytanoyl-CoA dioxygenase family protein [Capsulimonadaceae bacterium]|nr:phytanoyl-CoA dioxygenase family protein [Capsulimonadaceae bacterium]